MNLARAKLATVILAGISLGTAAPARADHLREATGSDEICVAGLDYPHFSKKSPGAIAKVHFICAGDIPSTIRFRLYIYGELVDFVGPPSMHEHNFDTIPGVVSGDWTRYVPPGSQPGLDCRKGYQYQATVVATLDGVPFTGPFGQTTPWRTSAQAGCP